LEIEDQEFSLDRYEPMARLLSEEDLHFVKAQAGYTPEIGRKFSRERRRIFRLYLVELSQDFQRLHAHARVIAASLPAENASLVGTLMHQQLRFRYQMVALDLKLRFAWAGLSVDVSGLVNAVAAMQAQVSRISAPSAA
jgi:hypothetical protein